MAHKIRSAFKYLLFLLLVWIGFIFTSIINYPEGKITDIADAAIVLGAAVYQSKPSPVFAERLNHAINIYHTGNINKLIFTGGTADKNIATESEVAKAYAISKQVKPSDIYIESYSVTTKQNLVYAKQIIEREKFNSVLIVSDSLHLKRAMLMANSMNINAKPSATPTSRYQSIKTKLPFALRELYFYHHYLLFGE